MEIAGEFVFDAPQHLVWSALLDPNVLGSVMPGGKGFEETGDNQYSGVLEVKVGPVQGNFQGQIALSDVVPPESYRIQVDGKGAAGIVNAQGQMRIEARGAQKTFMEYSGQAKVGGRIASVGQRLMDSAARSIIRQSLEGLNEYLKIVASQENTLVPQGVTESAPESMVESVADAAPEADSAAVPAMDGGASAASRPAPASPPVPPVVTAAPPAPPAPASQYKSPSQTQMGMQVARDMLDDIVPPKRQLPLLIGVLAAIALLLYLLLR